MVSIAEVRSLGKESLPQLPLWSPLGDPQQQNTWEGGMCPVPRILLELLSLFKLEYCRLIVGSQRKIMSRGMVLHGFSVFE
jgi:hypothetical protein